MKWQTTLTIINSITIIITSIDAGHLQKIKEKMGKIDRTTLAVVGSRPRAALHLVIGLFLNTNNSRTRYCCTHILDTAYDTCVHGVRFAQVVRHGCWKNTNTIVPKVMTAPRELLSLCIQHERCADIATAVQNVYCSSRNCFRITRPSRYAKRFNRRKPFYLCIRARVLFAYNLLPSLPL